MQHARRLRVSIPASIADIPPFTPGGGGGGTPPAVVFSPTPAVPSNSIRSARVANVGLIAAGVTGATSLGSNDGVIPTAGGVSIPAGANYATVGGGLDTLALGAGATVVGGEIVISSGNESIAGGQASLAAGDVSVSLGGQLTAMGEGSAALGFNNDATGDASTALGTSNRAGHTTRQGTIPAGGTLVTLTGVDATAEFANGDTVAIQPQGPVFAGAVRRTLTSVPVFAAGNTTFSINAAVDGTTTGIIIVDVTATFGATCSGGTGNTADAPTATIGGGEGNTIDNGTDHATIGGGQSNTIAGPGGHSTIAGGQNNTCGANLNIGTICGGQDNQIQGALSDGGFIGGGLGNEINGAGAGNPDNRFSTIGGGFQNLIQVAGDANPPAPSSLACDTIAGGFQCQIVDSGAGTRFCSIGGGAGNVITGPCDGATIAGGQDNTISNAQEATIPGGLQCAIGSGSDYAVCAGHGNTIGTGAQGAVIPGGTLNTIANGASNAKAEGQSATADLPCEQAYAAGQDAPRFGRQRRFDYRGTVAAGAGANLMLCGPSTNIPLTANHAYTVRFQYVIWGVQGSGGPNDNKSTSGWGIINIDGTGVVTPVDSATNGTGPVGSWLFALTNAGGNLQVSIQDTEGAGSIAGRAELNITEVG